MRVCRDCGSTESVERPFARSTWCKRCEADYAKKRRIKCALTGKIPYSWSNEYRAAKQREKYLKDPEPSKAAHRRWHLANKEKSNMASKKWYKENAARIKEKNEKNPIPRMLRAAKIRAEKKGRLFNIDESDISIPNVCPLLGIPFVPGSKTLAPSLDRIDSSKGYEKGNVWIISDLANRMKTNATLDQLEAFCRNYLRLFPRVE